MNPPAQTGAPPNAERPKKGNGVTSPSRRGGSGRVLTDVLVDLDFVSRGEVDEAIERATGNGSSPERLLLADGTLSDGQLARALDEDADDPDLVEHDQHDQPAGPLYDLTQNAPIVFGAGGEDSSVIQLVHRVIKDAVERGASDIHFEPGDDEMRVRYRIDGVLQEAATVPNSAVPAVTSRVKILSDLDIAERRIPQDGRISLEVAGKPIDLRVATLPCAYGENVVMRILDQSKVIIELEQLGMLPQALERFTKAFGQAHGAVLVTGPTGSGKSTSLYGALNQLNTIEKNIITIEDPVEYQLDGITQVQVNNKAGLSFANGLRSMMRADPDVIMVGEIRDRETAQIAIEAALTGHLVLSTLHTNDALRPLAVARAPAETIAHAAVHEGMMRLREDGLEKVRRGLTSISEIARVAGTR